MSDSISLKTEETILSRKDTISFLNPDTPPIEIEEEYNGVVAYNPHNKIVLGHGEPHSSAMRRYQFIHILGKGRDCSVIMEIADPETDQERLITYFKSGRSTVSKFMGNPIQSYTRYVNQIDLYTSKVSIYLKIWTTAFIKQGGSWEEFGTYDIEISA